MKHITNIYKEACERAQTTSDKMLGDSDEMAIFNRLDEEVKAIETDLESELEGELKRIDMEAEAAMEEIIACANAKKDKVLARVQCKWDELDTEGNKRWQFEQAKTDLRYIYVLGFLCRKICYPIYNDSTSACRPIDCAFLLTTNFLGSSWNGRRLGSNKR